MPFPCHLKRSLKEGSRVPSLGTYQSFSRAYEVQKTRHKNVQNVSLFEAFRKRFSVWRESAFSLFLRSKRVPVFFSVIWYTGTKTCKRLYPRYTIFCPRRRNRKRPQKLFLPAPVQPQDRPIALAYEITFLTLIPQTAEPPKSGRTRQNSRAASNVGSPDSLLSSSPSVPDTCIRECPLLTLCANSTGLIGLCGKV